MAYAASEPHPVVAESSAIRMNPADVPGVGLVISSLTWVVATGSKLMADGWPLAVAQVTLGLLTGAKAWPFQYVTVTDAGRLSVVLVTKVAASPLMCCACVQVSETHSLAWDTLTACKVAVAALL